MLELSDKSESNVISQPPNWDTYEEESTSCTEKNWGSSVPQREDEMQASKTTVNVRQFSEKTGSSYLLTDGHGSDTHGLINNYR